MLLSCEPFKTILGTQSPEHCHLEQNLQQYTPVRIEGVSILAWHRITNPNPLLGTSACPRTVGAALGQRKSDETPRKEVPLGATACAASPNRRVRHHEWTLAPHTSSCGTGAASPWLVRNPTYLQPQRPTLAFCRVRRNRLLCRIQSVVQLRRYDTGIFFCMLPMLSFFV